MMFSADVRLALVNTLIALSFINVIVALQFRLPKLECGLVVLALMGDKQLHRAHHTGPV